MPKDEKNKTVEDRLADLEERVKRLEEDADFPVSYDGPDDLFDEAVRVVKQYDLASASLIQRRLKVGYARAARILDELEEAGIVGPGRGAEPRKVIVEQENQN